MQKIDVLSTKKISVGSVQNGGILRICFSDDTLIDLTKEEFVEAFERDQISGDNFRFVMSLVWPE